MPEQNFMHERVIDGIDAKKVKKGALLWLNYSESTSTPY
jgi:hypothetical protein